MTRTSFPLQDQLRGFSRALFSTWLYHRRFNLLFDAGEGISTSLLNRVFGIRKVFLSHGHADHIAGLINLVNIRNLGAGDQTTDLEIYYPQGNALVEVVKNYLAQTQSELSFSLIWRPLEAGQMVALDDRRGKTFLRTFRTQHSQKQLSLGFNILEARSRLRPEFATLSQAEINQAIWTHGKERVVEPFEQIIFTYGGDSRPLPVGAITESLFLCHECTYLKREDDERNFHQHSILEEVLEVAAAARVKTLLLFHLSLRYTQEEVRSLVGQALRRQGYPFQVVFLFGDRFHPLADPRGRPETDDASEGSASEEDDRRTPAGEEKP
ncbi:MAG: Ribonuclease Z [Candidatus Ozemobacter sibiricus]|uniref:Ribonuclease Z n=1 Tax=Candidatus Ozemobacter sibiricus TaxID=2268124 RepID=A0A367ZK56_9BACT|nr:MAG: Ribonuclease Z [Candidatus Ozemobacter sibiricus]